MLHMMVDLETLDTRPSTVVLSMGAVIFDEDGRKSGPGNAYYQRCSWQDQLDAGRTVSESTIKWWMHQSDAAREALFGPCVTLDVALTELALLYRSAGCERIWANGTTFDISILEHAYAGRQPWKYNAMRDMRGLRDLVPLDIELHAKFSLAPAFGEAPRTAHNALDDAVYQAEFVVRALRFLRR